MGIDGTGRLARRSSRIAEAVSALGIALALSAACVSAPEPEDPIGEPGAPKPAMDTASTRPATSPSVSAAAPEPRVEYRRDVAYAAIGGLELRLDIAYSPEAAEPRPLLVYLPGNGYGDYVSFTKDKQWKGMFEPLLRQAAARGYVAAAINHTPLDRLVARGEPFPFAAMLGDVGRAIGFLVGSAAEYGIDAERVALLGWSSGGHLALSYAFGTGGGSLGGGGAPYVMPCAVVAASAVSDMVRLYEADSAQPEPYRANLVGLDEALFGGPPASKAAEYARGSPVASARADCPACLLLHGDKDVVVPFAQATALDEALGAAGASHGLVVIEGGQHKNYLGLPEVWTFLEGELLSRASP